MPLDAVHLRTQDARHVLRHGLAEEVDDLVGGVIDVEQVGHEAAQGGEKEEEREQRQEESISQFRGEAGEVVLLDRLQQLLDQRQDRLSDELPRHLSPRPGLPAVPRRERR